MNIEQRLERSRTISKIDNLYGQANSLFLDSTQCTDPKRADVMFAQGQALADTAEQLQVDYYNRFPNCMTRSVKPWAM